MPARQPSHDAVYELAEAVLGMDPAELERFASTLSPDDLDVLELAVGRAADIGRAAEMRRRSGLYPWQVAPLGNWRYWLLYGGRGIGKTQGGAGWFDAEMRAKRTRGRIIAPTIGDARGACVEGVSGILTLNPEVGFNRSWGELEWPNGSKARIFGAHTPEDVERLRAGGNSECDWYEELAAWRYLDDCWNQAAVGLRIGEPRAVVTTTPKPRLLIKALLTAAGIADYEFEDAPPAVKSLAKLDPGRVVVTRGRTEDAKYLAPGVRAHLLDMYEGTRFGAQELEGEIVEDTEGALWTVDLLERHRVDPDTAPDALRRVVVAVDPSWGTTSDECGIVVAGVGFDGRGYVLEDVSLRAAPAAWGQAVAEAYAAWKADMIVAEVNFQAEQVRLVMRTTDRKLPFKEVRASRGKQQRAEPVAALYQQGKVSHVGRFARLEDQMTTWVPGESGDFSPDRVDALVWALTDLMLLSSGPASAKAPSRPRPTPQPGQGVAPVRRLNGPAVRMPVGRRR